MISNVDEILEESTKKELYKVVEKLAGSENVKLSIERVSKIGYMGEIFRVHFKNPDDNHNSEQKSLILKIAPNIPMRREMTNVRECFLCEILMYDKVLTQFNDFQLSKGVNPKENGFNECAECYSTVNDDLSESLFLEDLSLRQFDVINLRQEDLTFEHLSLIMKALGKFHALSFALKDQQPENFKPLSTPLVEEKHWKIVERGFKGVVQNLFDGLMDCVKNEGRFDLVEKMKRCAGDDLCATVLQLLSDSSAESCAVICHGDVTTNNTMFRKDEQGKPIEVQLLDWQFSRYASPAIELVLYLLCSTTKELRDKHYNEFLKIYHDSLSDLLTRLGSDPKELFPYEALLEQLQKFGFYGVFVGAELLPILCSDVETMPNMDKVVKDIDSGVDDGLGGEVYTIRSEDSQRAYYKRVTDMIDDMARFGYI